MHAARVALAPALEELRLTAWDPRLSDPTHMSDFTHVRDCTVGQVSHAARVALAPARAPGFAVPAARNVKKRAEDDEGTRGRAIAKKVEQSKLKQQVILERLETQASCKYLSDSRDFCFSAQDLLSSTCLERTACLLPYRG